MTYKVRAVRRAERDVDAIQNWMANVRKSPKGAAAWLAAFEKASTALAHWPESYGLAPEDECDERELRQFLFKTRRGKMYRGIFTIQGDEIVILRVRSPGQRPLEPDEIPGD
jgi:plasmid stabilization system protein ParE